MPKKQGPVSYYPATVQRRPDIPRAYSVNRRSVILHTREAQVALERVEMGAVTLVGEEHMRGDDSPKSYIQNICFHLEDRVPDLFYRRDNDFAMGEKIHDAIGGILGRTEKLLQAEMERATGLLEKNYITDIEMLHRHSRAYSVEIMSVAYQRVIGLIEDLDQVLLKHEQLKFGGVYTAFQRKESGVRIMRSVLRTTNRLIGLEHGLRNELLGPNSDSNGQGQDSAEGEPSTKGNRKNGQGGESPADIAGASIALDSSVPAVSLEDALNDDKD